MNQGKYKITTFTDLETWKIGHQLVIKVYLVTKKFPKDELFGLTNQLRRAVVSITSNIAEGFSRQSYKEKVQFYSTASGSLSEVQNQLLIARDIGYIDNKTYDMLSELATHLSKLLNGLIKKSKSIILNS